MREFKLPELGENIESAEVLRVLVAEGDDIDADQNVLELETGKAAVELPCPYGGRVAKVHVAEGDTISIGDAVLSLDGAESEQGAGGDAEDAAKSEDETPRARDEEDTEQRDEREEETDDAPAEERRKRRAEAAEAEEKGGREAGPTKRPQSERKSTAESGTEEAARAEVAERGAARDRGPAGPGTRRLARELDVDLNEVQGTGTGGRITRQDVRAYARRGSAGRASLPDFELWGPVERRMLTTTMRQAARNLTTSWQEIPHVTHHELADITELETLRRQFLEKCEPEAKVTLTALTLKVVARTLADDRRFNSSFDPSTDETIVKSYIHIGFAVDTDEGLVVPVIRDCLEKSVVQLAGEVTELAERARAGKLEPQALDGGTFTITNLGGIGGVAFTPIIRHPEVAILGLSRAAWRPAEDGAETGSEAATHASRARRLLVPLSLSYDHRVIDGAAAARFAARIAALLAAPRRWLFEV